MTNILQREKQRQGRGNRDSIVVQLMYFLKSISFWMVQHLKFYFKLTVDRILGFKQIVAEVRQFMQKGKNPKINSICVVYVHIFLFFWMTTFLKESSTRNNVCSSKYSFLLYLRTQCTECPTIYSKPGLHIPQIYTWGDVEQICGTFWDTRYLCVRAFFSDHFFSLPF